MTIQYKLIVFLKKQKKTIAVAESLTGGYVSYLLTQVPGASDAFKFGAVVYSLASKHLLFNLSSSELNATQGVSEHIAHVLAKKVKRFSDADIGAAIVGFAGPQAPQGMKGRVYMAVASQKKVYTRKTSLKGTRNKIRKNASGALLEFILEKVAQ